MRIIKTFLDAEKALKTKYGLLGNKKSQYFSPHFQTFWEQIHPSILLFHILFSTSMFLFLFLDLRTIPQFRNNIILEVQNVNRSFPHVYGYGMVIPLN